MKKIFRYQIEINTTFFIELPKDAKILTVQSKDNVPNIWAEVNPENELEKRTFALYTTGAEIHSSKKEYIGTFQLRDGYNDSIFVAHLYEIL